MQIQKTKYVIINNNEIYEDFEKKIQFLEELNEQIEENQEVKLILTEIDEDLILLSEEILNKSPNIIILEEINENSSYEEVLKNIEELENLKVEKIILGIKDTTDITLKKYEEISKKLALEILSSFKNEKKESILNKIEIIPIESWIIYSYIISILKKLNNEDKIDSFLKNIDVPEELKIIYNKEDDKIKKIEAVKLKVLPILEKQILEDEEYFKFFNDYLENNLKVLLVDPEEIKNNK